MATQVPGQRRRRQLCVAGGEACGGTRSRLRGQQLSRAVRRACQRGATPRPDTCRPGLHTLLTRMLAACRASHGVACGAAWGGTQPDQSAAAVGARHFRDQVLPRRWAFTGFMTAASDLHHQHVCLPQVHRRSFPRLGLPGSDVHALWRRCGGVRCAGLNTSTYVHGISAEVSMTMRFTHCRRHVPCCTSWAWTMSRSLLK